MGNSTMVFTGIREFSLEPSPVTELDGPGFKAVCSFGPLEQLQGTYDPDFTHALAVCVTDCAEVEKIEAKEHDFPSRFYSLAHVLPDAVRWVLCFPVVRKQSGKYALQTYAVPPDGDGVFFFFTGPMVIGTPAQVVPDLKGLSLVLPCPGDKLAMVRAKNWRWDEKQNTFFVPRRDILEIEIIHDSEVRVF